MNKNKIKVHVVEDSLVVQKLLVNILESDPDIKVVGVSESAEHALESISNLKPDLITVDIQLPKMNGLALTQEIMSRDPIPIVVVSGTSEKKDVAKAFDLIEAGALAAIEKPVGFGHSDYQRLAQHFISTVKTMSEVKLVKRRTPLTYKKIKENQNTTSTQIKSQFEIIVIGASTGGPSVIQTILKDLPANYPLPIVIAQHIAPGFLSGLVQWLIRTTGKSVEIAQDNEKLKPGTIYLCPEGRQTGFAPRQTFKILQIDHPSNLAPSVSYLFQSACDTFGKKAVAVLLTGMGQDGANEMRLIKEAGGTTIAQDAESCVVHGMPGEAIKIGAVDKDDILPACKIGSKLRELAQFQMVQ
ncbi:MAG: chemotaxis-specific protein-glutamate methyltransferase CheB [Candidatus Melainabacteria bacterium]|nr:chemotaxis-specific protein-glutamate methyltransferase CheB [Candidatus Melainabacteria bacterium]